tara:strand:- start:701 stop:967 length:267 start_codon:yes stop_codon:yes gene_type:complete
MAKRKTKKVEKPTKISNEHLDKLQTVVNSINKAQMQIGVFQTNIHTLLHHIAGKNDELLLMQDEIEKKYGTTDINILDGTINQDGKAN